MTEQVVGRADYELRARLDQLRKDLAAAEAEIAQSGARTEAEVAERSSKWGSAMAAGVRTGVKVLAAGASAMFALAFKGADQLQRIQNDFQSETGATAEEAKRAGKVINQAAAENQLALEAVGAAAIAVHNDLGAVGDEADALTNQFAKFGRVTKQEPVAAVKAFDDILDSWSLTAADVPGLMDKLIVSHQRYGGAIAEDEAALAKLAPTMRAANLSVDDSISLINLFKASGVDATAAVTGLQHALSIVKSPAELQRLIADISATEDPMLRAKKAAELFGDRAGPKLANALAGKELDDFRINMEDAAGATDEAAEALDQGFGPWIRRNVSLLGGAIRGLGADWGPALTGVATFTSALAALGIDKALVGGWKRVAGSGAVRGAVLAAALQAGITYSAAAAAGDKLAGAVSGAWQSLAGSRAVTAAATAAGTSAGAAFAAAAVAAVALGVAAIGTYVWDQMTANAHEQQKGVSDAVQKIITEGSVDGMKAAREELRRRLKMADDGDWFDLDLDGTVANYRKDIAALDAALAGETRAGGAWRSWQAAFRDSTQFAMARVGDIIAENMANLPDVAAAAIRWDRLSQNIGRQVETIGRAVPEALAQGIHAARAKPVDAFTTLLELLKHPLSRAQERTRLLGQLVSKELAKGLRSGDPEIQAQARATRQYILDRLEELKTGSGKLTKEQAALVAKGLKSKDPEIRAAARHIKELATKPLERAKDDAHDSGQDIALQFAAGMTSRKAIDAVTNAARTVAGIVASFTAGNSPPPMGPLHTIDQGGENVIMAWSEGIARGIRHATSAARAASAGTRDALGAGGYATAWGGAAAGHGGGAITFASGAIQINGVGSDVSPAAATRFGQQVADEMANTFRDQSARTSFAGARRY